VTALSGTDSVSAVVLGQKRAGGLGVIAGVESDGLDVAQQSALSRSGQCRLEQNAVVAIVTCPS
jgi:hypothetical protein